MAARDEAIRPLPPIMPRPADPSVVAQAAAHPMRAVTRAVAAEVGAWQGETPAQVQGLFDGLAGEWHTRITPDRLAALDDALVRGGPLTGAAPWLELGCGDGACSATIAARAGAAGLVAVDLSMEMLRQAPEDAVPRAQADAAQLPLSDHSIGVAVLLNMLLFPTELDRILRPDGQLVWVSSRGPATPIYLSAREVAAALPGRWGGVSSQHGETTWAVLRRIG